MYLLGRTSLFIGLACAWSSALLAAPLSLSSPARPPGWGEDPWAGRSARHYSSAAVRTPPRAPQRSPGLLDKLFGRGAPPRSSDRQEPRQSALVRAVRHRLAQVKARRQALARTGSSRELLATEDRRVAGYEQLLELAVRRQVALDNGTPAAALVDVDTRIKDLAAVLKKIPDPQADIPGSESVASSRARPGSRGILDRLRGDRRSPPAGSNSTSSAFTATPPSSPPPPASSHGYRPGLLRRSMGL